MKNLDSGIKTHEEDTQDTKNDIQNNETENKPDNDIKILLQTKKN